MFSFLFVFVMFFNPMNWLQYKIFFGSSSSASTSGNSSFHLLPLKQLIAVVQRMLAEKNEIIKKLYEENEALKLKLGKK